MNAQPNSEHRKCLTCGAMLPSDAPDGNCPECLMRLASADQLGRTGATLATESSIAPRLTLQPSPQSLSMVVPAPFAPRSLGDYELIEEIARGGMGIVYKARQKSLNRIVAVKLLVLGELSSEAFIQRFRVEAQAAASLKHPNIVAIYEIGHETGQHYFSMEYVEGQNLAQLVRDKPLPAKKAAAYVKVIAEAIHSAHEKGILHRDLKPSNALIDADDRVRVTDFGLAKRLPEPSRIADQNAQADLTLTGQVLGTPNYLSPEQALGRKELSAATDVYALGGILYYLLTARPPFQADTLAETLQQVVSAEPVSPRLLNASVPADLETICLKCLEKESARRYASARDLAEELERFLNSEPIHARPISRVAKAWRWCRRNPRLATLAASTASLLLVLAIGAPIATVRIARDHSALRQSLYVADMANAHQALLNYDIGRVQQLVKKYFPEDGEMDLRGLEWRLLWQASRPAHLHSFPAFQGEASCAVFSPDGRQLASASYDRSAQVLDPKNLTILKRLEGYFDGPILNNALAYSPDGQFLACKGGTRLRIWRTDDWVEATPWITVERKDNLTDAVAFSPDGASLASRVPGGVGFFDTATWQRKGPLIPDTDLVRGTLGGIISYSSDGELLAVSDRWEVQIREATNPQTLITTLARPLPEQQWRVLSTAISTQHVAVGYRDGTLVIWDRKTWTVRRSHALLQSFLMALAFSPDGRFLASGGSSSTVVQIWAIDDLLKPPNQARAFRPVHNLQGHVMDLNAVNFSRDGSLLATAGEDRTVKLWNIPQHRPTSQLPGTRMPIWFSLDGQRFAALHTDDRLHFWDLQTRHDLGPVDPQIPWTNVSAYAISTDGEQLALGMTNGAIQIWQLRAMVCSRTIPGDGLPIQEASFSSDDRGTFLVTISAQQWPVRTGLETTGDTYRLYDLRNPGPPREFKGGVSYGWGYAFSPDGKSLALINADRGLSLVGLHSDRQSVLGDDSEKFCSVAFSPDGKSILAATARQPFVWLWDIESGRGQTLLRLPTDVPMAVFSPDGKTILTCDWDNVLRFWNLNLRQELLAIPNANPAHWGVWFSSKGNALAWLTSREHASFGEVELWQVPTLAEISILEQIRRVEEGE